MDIKGLDQLQSDLFVQGLNQDTPTETSFQETFNASVQALSQMSNKSSDLSNSYAAGEDVSLQDVMVASQEADIAMRLAVQMRNKVLEAYREIIRMPV